MDVNIICKSFTAEDQEKNIKCNLGGVDPYDLLDELLEYFETDLDENDIIINIFKNKNIAEESEFIKKTNVLFNWKEFL